MSAENERCANSYLFLAVIFFTALAVLRSQETRLIFAPGAKRPSPPLPTDAKLRVESSLLELYRGAKEEKPPLGGLKGVWGKCKYFCKVLVSVIVFGFRMLSKIAQ